MATLPCTNQRDPIKILSHIYDTKIHHDIRTHVAYTYSPSVHPHHCSRATLFWLFSFWGLLVGMTHQFPIWKVIYRLLGVQVNVGDRWGAVKHYFIRWTWFTDFSKTKSTLLGTNLQTWWVQVKMLLTNLLTWRVLQTWRVQVNEE